MPERDNTPYGKLAGGVGPSDVLGRDEAIRLVREALERHHPELDGDGIAVHAVIVLDKAMADKALTRAR